MTKTIHHCRKDRVSLVDLLQRVVVRVQSDVGRIDSEINVCPSDSGNQVVGSGLDLVQRVFCKNGLECFGSSNIEEDSVNDLF